MPAAPVLTADVAATTQSPNAHRQRQAARVALEAQVMLRRSGKTHYRVHVFDISPHGCRVEFIERPGIEELLWVEFDGLDLLEAVVCWTRGAHAGLVFPRPIHPAVFDVLLAQLRRQSIY